MTNSLNLWLLQTTIVVGMPGGGHWPRNGVWGCAAGPEDPLFTPLLPLARVPFQAKESVHKTPFWENLEILASTASIFTQILAHKPPNLEFFSSQEPKFGNFPLTSPPFQRQMSVRKPHTSEIRATHPYLKKSWVPPPPGRHVKLYLTQTSHEWWVQTGRNLHIFSKLNIWNSNYHFHIWIQHEQCILMSANKPSIGAVIHEISQ